VVSVLVLVAISLALCHHLISILTLGGLFLCPFRSIQRLVTSIKCKFGYQTNTDMGDEATVDGENINFESLRTVKVDELWILKQVSGEFYVFPII
jgi:hypothetical protein